MTDMVNLIQAFIIFLVGLFVISKISDILYSNLGFVFVGAFAVMGIIIFIKMVTER